MKTLPPQYDTKATESRWQKHWLENGTYQWDESASRAETYVIDTPPPTVSGHLHMGHIFSYTQADFIARYQRMAGKTVFYPMGYDDNGLPTERLVEKVKKKRAVDYATREEFIAVCTEVSEEARQEFRKLFQSVALSVDWRQEYHTISEQSRRLSQLSFLDLHRKGKVERRLQPMLWDPVDQTAIAQAEVEDKELDSHFNDILFAIDGSDETITIGTTRPELIPACVGIFYHPEDARYQHLKGKQAVTPLFGIKVPIYEDESVEPEKGTGIMMCCTFGDEKDIEKWRKHNLKMRISLTKYGKTDFKLTMFAGNKAYAPTSVDKLLDKNDGENRFSLESISLPESHAKLMFVPYDDVIFSARGRNFEIENKDCLDLTTAALNLRRLCNLSIKKAREEILVMLNEKGLLLKSTPIKHAVKCAERSGAPLEYLPTPQWFVKIIENKEELKKLSHECSWHPDWMKRRMDQWIDGLNWDWCISRQRYYGIPFPVWRAHEIPSDSNKITSSDEVMLLPDFDALPVNPIVDIPPGFRKLDMVLNQDGTDHKTDFIALEISSNKKYWVSPDTDVMDTWATSSLSPQLSSHAISPDLPGDHARHAKLYPADLRPQAHEIIRTWAFYTLVKSHLHADSKPWQNLMISGWCLAEDKSKMSKSKGNIVTPIDLIEESGADAVRYWASTSRLGADTAFSKDVLKIGRKLVTKLWNASKFAALHFDKLQSLPAPETAVADIASSRITATLDKWILTRLHRAVAKASEEFARYEYATARSAVEDFFWNDFCDNYLELVKRRAYNEAGDDAAGQQSALYTLHHCLDTILRLFAPFVPHVTEELWSHIFEEKAAQTSLHARGQWPNAANFPQEREAEAQGTAVVELLESLRKAKSEQGISIKWPIAQAVVQRNEPEAPMPDASAQNDLAGAGNIHHLIVQTSEVDAELVIHPGRQSDPAAFGVALEAQSETGHYRFTLRLAAQSDAA